MGLLYTLFVQLYQMAIRVAALCNPKAKLFIAGRKGLLQKLKAAKLTARDSKLAWFHCASLGEFEQGRPLIEGYRRKNPAHKILLTFFSPSGYEIRKNYEGADLICYLPVDTPGNAKRFLDLVQPDAVFFVKYEFWFNYLSALKERKIPAFLVSGIFRPDHYFFKATGTWARKQLSAFTYFFLQDERSLELLHSIGYQNAFVSGDTRFDRVVEIAKNAKQLGLVRIFSEGRKVLILGSSWPGDERLVAECLPQISSHKLIIAPHEVNETHISNIEAMFKGALRYSNADEKNIVPAQVLIIDNIGMLSSLYQYGSIAFIGGGFGKGIHNILEAATFGIPVIFGPNYEKFREAKDLLRLGGAFSVNDQTELKRTFALLSDEQVRMTAAQISKMYVQGRSGATERILNRIEKMQKGSLD